MVVAVGSWTMRRYAKGTKGVVVQSYLPLLGNLIVAAGAILAAFIAANRGVKAYREQKRQDREEELIRRRQSEYESFLTAFGTAGRWKGVDPQKHYEAENKYHAAHNNLLLIASEKVIECANQFHSYYVNAQPVEPKEMKLRYARMVVEMRKEVFEETKLSVREVAMNIPWTVGNEDVVPIDWGDNHEG